MSSKNHVKFGEDTEVAVATPELSIDDTSSSKVSAKKTIANLSDSDSESDDEAPMEEGAATTRDAIESKLQEAENAKKLEQQRLKEKRRKQNAVFQEQQSAKKQKEAEEQADDEELEELPAEFLQEVDNTEEVSEAKHINFDADTYQDDEDEEEILALEKAQLKKKKKNQLRALRRKTVRHGPVSVTLLASSVNTRHMAPKKEVSITSTKDKWLRRKTLDRR